MHPVPPSVGDSAFRGLGMIDLLQFLGRRRWWILSGLIGVVMTAAVLALSQTPIYEARAQFRIGQVSGGGPFENPDAVIARLLSTHGEKVAEGLRRERPFLSIARTSRTAPTIIDLVAEGYQPDDPVDLLKRLIAEIESVHGAIYEANVRQLNDRISAIEMQLAALREQGDQMAKLVGEIKASSPVQASLLALERARIEELAARLSADSLELRRRLAPPISFPTELLGGIHAPSKPSAPRKQVIMALSLVVGTILGVLLAAVAELFAWLRRKGDQPAPV